MAYWLWHTKTCRNLQPFDCYLQKTIYMEIYDQNFAVITNP